LTLLYFSLTHSFAAIYKFRIAKFGLKKLGAPLYGMVHSIFPYLEPFWCDWAVWPTGRRTDR